MLLKVVKVLPFCKCACFFLMFGTQSVFCSIKPRDYVMRKKKWMWRTLGSRFGLSSRDRCPAQRVLAPGQSNFFSFTLCRRQRQRCSCDAAAQDTLDDGGVECPLRRSKQPSISSGEVITSVDAADMPRDCVFWLVCVRGEVVGHLAPVHCLVSPPSGWWSCQPTSGRVYPPQAYRASADLMGLSLPHQCD